MISTETHRNEYTGNGATATYAFDFKIINESDLEVIKTLISTGVSTTLTLTTDYTVTGEGEEDGGSITLTAGNLASTYTLVIRRVVDVEQNTTLRNQGPYFQEAIEDALDYGVMIDQQQQDDIDLAIKGPVADTASMGRLPTAALRASKYLYFDSNGDPTAASAVSNSVITTTAFTQTLLDDSTAAGFMTTLGISSYAQTILDDADAATARATLGFTGTSGTVQNAQIDDTVRWQSSSMFNGSLSASVASSALTINLLGPGGSTPSAASPAYIGFRNATSATGTYSRVSTTSALSMVVSSGSTLGHLSAVAHYIYVYALLVSGAAELAVSTSLFDDGSVVSTTAEGGSGGADSNAVMYSTTARSNVPCRLLGRMLSTQTTAGTWAAVPTEISLAPFRAKYPAAVYTSNTATTITNASATIADFEDKVVDTYNAVTVGASWKFTAPIAGLYQVSTMCSLANQTGWEVNEVVEVRIYKNGTHYLTIGRQVFHAAATAACSASGSALISLAVGDYIDIRVYQDNDTNIALNATTENNWISIAYVPFL